MISVNHRLILKFSYFAIAIAIAFQNTSCTRSRSLSKDTPTNDLKLPQLTEEQKKIDNYVCEDVRFESYKTTISETKHYLDKILPALIHLEKVSPTPSIKSIAEHTSFYLHYCNQDYIKNIKQDVLAESGEESFQTIHGIFVDARLFQKKSSDEKAKFLLKELLVRASLAKYLPFDEICNLYSYKDLCTVDFKNTFLTEWKPIAAPSKSIIPTQSIDGLAQMLLKANSSESTANSKVSNQNFSHEDLGQQVTTVMQNPRKDLEKSIATTKIKGDRTPLMQAIRNNLPELAKSLIESGVDINAKTSDGFTALGYAFERQQIEIAKLLIAKGAQLNNINSEGDTALIATLKFLSIHSEMDAQDSLLNLARKLIGTGVDINTKTKVGYTALGLAFEWGQIDIANRLINKGVQLNNINPSCDTALIAALKMDTEIPDIEFLKKLLILGVNINAVDKFDNTALEIAAKKYLNFKDGKIVKFLLSENADIVESDEEYYSPNKLKKVFKYSISFVKLYLEKYPGKITEKDFQDWLSGIIDNAAEDANDETGTEIAEALTYIKNINFKMKMHDEGNSHYTTPLAASIAFMFNGGIDPVYFLIKAGAKLSTEDLPYESKALANVLSAARGYDGEKLEKIKYIAKFLINSGANLNALGGDENSRPIYYSIINNLNEITKLLIISGAQVNELDEQLNNALHVAIKANNTEIISYLLKNNPRLIHGKNKSNETPIAGARCKKEIIGFLALSQILLPNDISLNCPTSKEPTFLQAVSLGLSAQVKKFISQKTNLDISDDDGNTALIIATKNLDYGLIKILIDHGANINLANSRKQTALEVFFDSIALVDNNSEKIFKLLIDSGAELHIDNKKKVFEKMLQLEFIHFADILLAKEYHSTVKDILEQHNWAHIFDVGDEISEDSQDLAYYKRYIEESASTAATALSWLRSTRVDLRKLNSIEDNVAIVAVTLNFREILRDIIINEPYLVDRQNLVGETALMRAIRLSKSKSNSGLLRENREFLSSRIQLIKLLLSAKPNKNIKNKNGETALDLAVKLQVHPAIIRLLD